jgi:hypothetical protein
VRSDRVVEIDLEKDRLTGAFETITDGQRSSTPSSSPEACSFGVLTEDSILWLGPHLGGDNIPRFAELKVRQSAPEQQWQTRLFEPAMHHQSVARQQRFIKAKTKI